MLKGKKEKKKASPKRHAEAHVFTRCWRLTHTLKKKKKKSPVPWSRKFIANNCSQLILQKQKNSTYTKQVKILPEERVYIATDFTISSGGKADYSEVATWVKWRAVTIATHPFMATLVLCTTLHVQIVPTCECSCALMRTKAGINTHTHTYTYTHTQTHAHILTHMHTRVHPVSYTFQTHLTFHIHQ